MGLLNDLAYFKFVKFQTQYHPVAFFAIQIAFELHIGNGKKIASNSLADMRFPFITI